MRIFANSSRESRPAVQRIEHGCDLSAALVDALLLEAQDRSVYAFEIVAYDPESGSLCFHPIAGDAYRWLRQNAKQPIIKLTDDEQLAYVFLALDMADAALMKMFLD